MPLSAAERIVIDDEVLAAQSVTLRSVSERLTELVEPAGAQLGNAAFGAMNAFLLGPMNGLASHTSELVAAAGEMADRMLAGVDGARKQFDLREEEAAATFANHGEGAGS